MKDINELRKGIDSIDSQITELFLARMNLAKEIGIAKKESGSSVNVPSRENDIVTRLTKMTDEDELKGYINRLYADIFAMSKAYQNGIVTFESTMRKKILDSLAEEKNLPVSARVACQGVQGAYSNAAAKKLFELPDITFFKTFDGVFTAVEKGLCTYGILPIENSNTGSISQVYDLMRKHNFYIVSGVRVHIRHTLSAKMGTEIGDIKTVYSHEQGLRQCSEYLKKLGVEVVVVENTAVAARLVSECDRTDVAAVCAPDAAEHFGLKILQHDVQDNKDNYTRFICVSKKFEIFRGADKISIVIGASHTPGSLQRLLSEFSSLGLNLTKLESRPVGNSDFEFVFYFDFEADIRDNRVIDLLSRLTETNPSFLLLGSYKEKL